MKFSLMTINMVFPVLMKVMMEHDLEDALELYDEMLDLVKDSGFKAVDVTRMELDCLGFEQVKAALDKRGLSVCSLIHMDEFASMEDSRSEVLVDRAKKAVDEAIALGAQILMLVPEAGLGSESPTQGSITDDKRTELADWLIKNWRPVVQYAKEKGIHAVIEDTPNLQIPLCTREELSYVLDNVPGLEVVYDSGNMILVDEDPVEYFETFKDRIAHIHLKDMMPADPSNKYADRHRDGRKMTAAPSGEGMIDFPPLVECIRKSGYDGYLTVEFAKGEEEYLASLIKARRFFEELFA